MLVEELAELAAEYTVNLGMFESDGTRDNFTAGIAFAFGRAHLCPLLVDPRLELSLLFFKLG